MKDRFHSVPVVAMLLFGLVLPAAVGTAAKTASAQYSPTLFGTEASGRLSGTGLGFGGALAVGDPELVHSQSVDG